MRTLKHILFVLIMTPFLFSCDEENENEEEDVQRTTHVVTLHNNLGEPGCFGFGDAPVVFIVSYRDIQVEATINPGASGFINVLVEDAESINVIVQKLDTEIIANANVNVRTTSRPESLDDLARIITFCENFSLIFENF